MYPRRELMDLARSKAVLRGRIARHRTRCASAAAVATRPLGWIDQALGVWRAFSPIAASVAWPAGAHIVGALFRGHKTIGPLLRWAPAALGAFAVLRRLGRRGKT